MRNNHLYPLKTYLSLLTVLFSCIFFSFTASCAPSGKVPPKAVKGVLDLRDWDFEKDGNINLDGEWEFYWKEFPVGDALELPEEKKDFITVPSVWNGHIVKRTTETGEAIEEKLGGEGYATYRLKILLGKGGRLAFRAPHLGTAYTLYANNKVIGKLGSIGKTDHDSIPNRNTQYIFIDTPPDTEELNLILSISNFHYTEGGFWYSILIGSEEEVRNTKDSYLSLDLFVMGILFIMGIYHLSLYTLRREDRSPLYFGIYCLLTTLRTLLNGEKYLHNILPNLNYTFSLSFSFLTIYMGIPIFFEFLNSLYPKEINQSIRKTILLIQSFFCFTIIVLPSLYYTKTQPVVDIILLFLIMYGIFVLIKGIKNKREGAKTFLSGFLILALFMINDTLNQLNIITTGLYSPLGLVAFIFSQSFLLTSRFANAFRQVKDLTQNLEKRTQTLALANQEIADSRKDTEELNDLIKNINSVSSLTDVMMYLMFYLETNYAYNSFWLVLSDKKSNLLQTSVCVSSTLSKDAIEYLKNLSFYPEDPLSICSTYREQKLVYRDKEDSLLSDSDHDILNKTEFSYLFHLPFVIYGECIGILTIHKADGEKIPLIEQERMSHFTDLISGAVYNSILYRDSQVAKEQAEKSFQKSKNLNDMIEVIIQSKSTDEIFGRIFEMFSEKYGLTSYLVYILDKEDGFIKLYKTYGDDAVEKSYLALLYKNWFRIDDRECVHTICIVKNRSFLIKKIHLPHPSKEEEENILLGGIKSMLIIPLTIDNESFGSISFSDNKYFKSYIKDISKSTRIEIENFIRLISPSIYQSLQKTIIEKSYHEIQLARNELSQQKAQMERLQAMSQEIQRKTNFEDMLRSLEEILWETYKIGDYFLYILNLETNQIELNAMSRQLNNLGFSQKMRSVSLSEEKSIHRLIFQKKRSLYLSKLKVISNGEDEDYNREILEMASIFAIPFIVNDESFAVLSYSDIKAEYSRDPNIKGVKSLTFKQRTEIEQLVSLISNALHQSLQKAKIEKAYSELQETQAQLVEAERMASLGQLVGGIAHEINNPIAVIRSHAELLEANNRTTLWEIPKFLETLTPTEKNIFYDIVDSSVKNKVFLNSKEERKQRKELEQELSDVVQDEDLRTTLAESIVRLRLPPPYKDYIEELGGERFATFLSRAEVFKNQSNSISSIDIAAEKATRVVFALRNYLNTQLFFEKKEIDLVTELEKALHVYDNYVMGKINVRKEFPSELKYSCVSENLLQVWKNIFFNAIQAMYTTDKKLEIRLEKWENLPDSLKSYKTSSIVEESIFQKEERKGWVVVSITDSGVGIPSELQEKVFTPFFTTKALGEGIGLGLYTCKKIVHEHGGALFFKSEGGSTEFKVVLPA